jgi:hypothetical protein
MEPIHLLQNTPVTLMFLSISRFVGGQIAEEWQLEHRVL